MFLSVASCPASDGPDAPGGGARLRSQALCAGVWRKCLCGSLKLSTRSVALEPSRAQREEWPRKQDRQAGGQRPLPRWDGLQEPVKGPSHDRRAALKQSQVSELISQGRALWSISGGRRGSFLFSVGNFINHSLSDVEVI